MNTIPWPEPDDVDAICDLLCRPAPPVVASETLKSCASARALLIALGEPEPDRTLRTGLERAVEAWRQTRGGLLLFHDRLYPPSLLEIAHPPVALFVRGDVSTLRRPAIAIVGARAASTAACTWTRHVAADLARCGVMVWSGLARGIDAAAHRGALDAGEPTGAVLGCGPDIVYPPEHATLAAEIEAHGVLASEFPPGTPPRPWHFPQRNRILAGLAAGVVVVQAEMKSGALVTARHAIDENREVMAVPGDVDDPRSRGPHRLLRDGAALVESASDVLAALRWDIANAANGLGGEHARVLALLPLGPDVLRMRLGWTVPQLQSVLAELELAGAVRRDTRGRVARTAVREPW